MDSTREEKREYLSTHPWINFKLDIQSLNFRMWMLLGEAQSKCEHLAGVPLMPEAAKKMHDVYLVKGALGTTAIEGNTLTEEEVQKHLEGQLKLPVSKRYMQTEIDNILVCYSFITGHLAKKEAPPLSFEQIKAYNRKILEGLTLADHVTPGEVSEKGVTVGRYRGAPRQDCEYLLTRLCEWLRDEDYWGSFPPDFDIAIGLIRAIVAHVYLAWIHPFGDGNGRTARILEFQLMMEAGVPSAAAHLLSNHYNQTRSMYYLELDKTSKTHDLTGFIAYSIQGFVDGLKEQLAYVRHMHWTVTWQHLVHAYFAKGDKKSEIRRRNLVLDLANQSQPVPFNDIENISPRVAVAYADKSSKTLRQDLQKLMDARLIVRDPNGYRANHDLVLAFLPVSAWSFELVE